MGAELFIGIDVSKVQFDVDSRPACLTGSFRSDAAGLEELTTTLSACHPHLIVVEATGSYHQPVVDALHAAGLPVFVANPRWVRHFAQGRGLLAKTDRIDAAVLALYAEKVRPQLRPLPDADQQTLQALVQRRLDLMQTLIAEQARRHHARPEVRADIDEHVRYLQGRLRALAEQIQALIARDPRRQEDYDLHTSVKGVGPICGSTLVALLPELGHLDHKRIAALAGLAPYNCDSGRHQGTRRCWGGRAPVRNALYMATLSAVRYNPQIGACYDRLLERGKPQKLARIACAHKLLTILNAMLRDRTPWQPEIADAA